MNQTDKMIIAFAILGVVALIIWRTRDADDRGKPILHATEKELADHVVGDSSPVTSRPGPAYMAANYSRPMPLALWNPPTTVLQ